MRACPLLTRAHPASQTSTSGANRGKTVALKEIDLGTLEEDEEALEMLEAEVLALRRAGSIDGVVRLHEVVACQEAIFLAMERVPGRELFELVEERGALDAHLVKLLMQQLLTTPNGTNGWSASQMAEAGRAGRTSAVAQSSA